MHQSVLLIEEEPLLQPLIEALALPCDFNITQAITGFDGLRLATSLKFNLIFVDVMLSQVDGLDVLRLLRWQPLSQGSRLIAVSSTDSPTLRGNTYAAGADYFLHPPYNAEAITAALNQPYSA
jgi:DNA-binding response OmpR family regulator